MSVLEENIYLHDIPLAEAQARLHQALAQAGLGTQLSFEEIILDENAAGRVLAEAVWAKISSPHYHASAMDGFAVSSISTAEAALNQPVTLRCFSADKEAQLFPAGDSNHAGDASYVDTGDPLPGWADAVIPIENVEALDDGGNIAGDLRQPGYIRIRSAVTPWSHVRPMGEDMVATQLVLPAGHTLRPVDLGAVAACGHASVRVVRRPLVAVLPTGSELVPIGKPVDTGDIIEYNSLVLAAQINQWGGEAHRFPITPDRFELIRRRVAEAAAHHDLVLLNAGSSAGSEDFSARVVQALGELLVHGVAVRPGHPVILGMLHPDKVAKELGTEPAPENLRKIPIVGVPGYPVSAALTGEIFIEPVLARWLGRQPFEAVQAPANLTRKVTSPAGDDDYMRVAVGRVGEKLLAAPLARGSGVITSLVRADGIAVIPRGSQGLPAGAQVQVRLYRQPAELERTIFAIGSHDMSLDLMAQYLAARGRRLASANVGSQGGLVAIKRGEAHLAGSHLLDPETGDYNIPYIRQYLPDVRVKLIALVDREQGLLVKPGNPKHILSLCDLNRMDVSFVNRQRGAGTRLLLDYHLSLLGIAPDEIRGYNQEEYTHLAVAAAVASGRADCGLAIAASAQALGLDFIPLYQEHYELVIPEVYIREGLLQPLIEILHEPAFRKAVASMPGYDISRMGMLVAEV
jgi:putative molybdopterin biosynthesis protein